MNIARTVNRANVYPFAHAGPVVINDGLHHKDFAYVQNIQLMHNAPCTSD